MTFQIYYKSRRHREIRVQPKIGQTTERGDQHIQNRRQKKEKHVRYKCGNFRKPQRRQNIVNQSRRRARRRKAQKRGQLRRRIHNAFLRRQRNSFERSEPP